MKTMTEACGHADGPAMGGAAAAGNADACVILRFPVAGGSNCPSWCRSSHNLDDDNGPTGGVSDEHLSERISWSDKPNHHVQLERFDGYEDEPAAPASIYIVDDTDGLEGIKAATAVEARCLAAALLKLGNELESG